MFLKTAFILLIIVCSFGCSGEKEEVDCYVWKSKKVTASAYNSTKAQTNSDPHITAFGDSVKPGLKYIAVSRDLLVGDLKYNTRVKIEGLDSIYLVKDKMNSRWKNKIDIYMGLDIKAAKLWGKKKVCIEYLVMEEENAEIATN